MARSSKKRGFKSNRAASAQPFLAESNDARKDNPVPLSQTPCVSIVTVTYNRPNFLPLLEQRILEQTYPREKLEWILIDDSPQQVEDFRPTPNTNLTLIYKRLPEKLTLGKKRNLSHSFCRGDVIVYMDDDDYYPPTRVEHAVKRLMETNNLVAGSTLLPVLFVPENELWLAGPYHKNHATAGTFAFRKELLNETSYCDDAILAEERQFLKEYSLEMAQLEPRHTIICIGHNRNTFEKRQLVNEGKNPRFKRITDLNDGQLSLVQQISQAYQQAAGNVNREENVVNHRPGGLSGKSQANSPTIYLHWCHSAYDWIRSGLYHTIVSGHGHVHRLHAYTADLPAHTWQRNSNAIALACACMGGQPDPWAIPPTRQQLEALCQEVAAIARSRGWSADEITIERLMTHAEAAANRDGRNLHDNYGPAIWGGTGECGDLLQLGKDGPQNGGEQLRERVRQILRAEPGSGSSAGMSTSGGVKADHQLALQHIQHIPARGESLMVRIDTHGICWARATDLLERYAIPYAWNSDQHQFLVGASDVVPRHQGDGVQPSVGWPLFEMNLLQATAPVILRGILWSEHPGQPEDAWCRVLEFAREFGISMTAAPFSLGERRGG